MNDSIEFTPKEKFQISLYENVDSLYKRHVSRALRYLIPSVALIAYYFYSGDDTYAIFGYGILLFQIIYKLIVVKSALKSTASIYQKYEARLQKKQDAN